MVFCRVCGQRIIRKHNSIHSRSTWIKVSPGRDELPQVVRAEDGGVSGEVVKVVHDDGHEQVDHDEGAEEDEADKVEIGGVASA